MRTLFIRIEFKNRGFQVWRRHSSVRPNGSPPPSSPPAARSPREEEGYKNNVGLQHNRNRFATSEKISRVQCVAFKCK